MSFDSIPIWAVFVATILVVMAAIEAGLRLGSLVHGRTDHEKESPISAIAATILGLSAFLLAFAFGIVWDRYDARKALVLNDAATIRTVWQRSDILPDAERAEAKKLLREYVDLRLAFTRAASRDRDVPARIQEIQDRLWTGAVVNARRDMNSDVGALYIDSLNAMNNVHAARVAVGIQMRVPVEIWFALYCITILGMFGVGYQTGIADSKRSISWPVLAVSFALAFAMIASLDRPDSGIMTVSQRPLIDLQTQMATSSLASGN